MSDGLWWFDFRPDPMGSAIHVHMGALLESAECRGIATEFHRVTNIKIEVLSTYLTHLIR